MLASHNDAYKLHASYLDYFVFYVRRSSWRLDKSSLIGKEEAGLLCLFFWGLEARQKVVSLRPTLRFVALRWAKTVVFSCARLPFSGPGFARSSFSSYAHFLGLCPQQGRLYKPHFWAILAPEGTSFFALRFVESSLRLTLQIIRSLHWASQLTKESKDSDICFNHLQSKSTWMV